MWSANEIAYHLGKLCEKDLFQPDKNIPQISLHCVYDWLDDISNIVMGFPHVVATTNNINLLAGHLIKMVLIRLLEFQMHHKVPILFKNWRVRI